MRVSGLWDWASYLKKYLYAYDKDVTSVIPANLFIIQELKSKFNNTSCIKERSHGNHQALDPILTRVSHKTVARAERRDKFNHEKYTENQAPTFVQGEASILKLFDIFYYGLVQHFPNCFLLDITILINIIIIFWGGGQ